MTTYFTRVDNSVLSRWWWTVDKWSFAALAALVAIGALLIFAASPPSAARIGVDRFHFVRIQLVLLPLALVLMFGVSLLPARDVRRLGIVLFLVALVLTVATLFVGAEIKGARRWIGIGARSFQPSELLKPGFAIFAAWMFALGRERPGFPGALIAVVTGGAVVGVLALQPDLGMAMLVATMCLAQMFVAGVRMFWMMVIGGTLAAGAVGAYYVFPHVAGRINAFRDPSGSDNYQIDKALEAFGHGGLFGQGPGEGTVKNLLPDAHADFIFAVAGEEFGLIVCLIIVAIYAFIVLRGMARLAHQENYFVLLSALGLLAVFGTQALVNMASALHLIPTKGTTLPFISYGGSSLIALAIGMGMVLALTRRGAGDGSLP
jgi:cell division protein FtsW